MTNKLDSSVHKVGSKVSAEQTGGTRLLTEVELELMTLLWKLGEGTVHEVLETLPTARPLAYTSVSTILRILEQKQIVGTRKEGRRHVYFPKLERDAYEAAAVRHVVKHVFGGVSSQLVRRLIETETLSDSELQQISELLERRSEP